MARNTWDSSRDNDETIMRRGDDRTIDYGRGGDSRRGNEYRNSQWKSGSDSQRFDSQRMDSPRMDSQRSDSQRSDYMRDSFRDSSAFNNTDSYRSADREEGYVADRDMSYANRDSSRSNPNRYETSRFGADRYTGDRSMNDRYDSDRYSSSSSSMNGGVFSRDSSASTRTTYGQPNTGGQNYSQTFGQQYGSTPWSASSDSSQYSSSSTYGIHSGKGPKGYRRSDERIKEEVSDALERHPSIDASELEVDVKDGIVTLKGHVEERRIKRMAEDAIENLAGVRDVRNELLVDQSLFQRAKEALFGSSLDSETAPSQSSKSARSKH